MFGSESIRPGKKSLATGGLCFSFFFFFLGGGGGGTIKAFICWEMFREEIERNTVTFEEKERE